MSEKRGATVLWKKRHGSAAAWGLWLALVGSHASAGIEVSVSEARQLLQRGRYAEAAEAFQALAAAEPVVSALGEARCLAARGRSAEAAARLEAAALRHPDSADVQAELALLAWRRGQLSRAEQCAQAAVKLDEDHLAARFVLARLDQQAGRLEAAGAGYAWLVKRSGQPEIANDAEALLWVGRAAAEHARWKRLPEEFQLLVGKLYPSVLRADPDYWQAHLEAGRLFLEKYNEADASRRFQAALAINPNAADVHAAMAEMALANYDLDVAERHAKRALEIDPECTQAWELLADWHLARFRIAEALSALEHARRLNGVSESALARLAAIHALTDGWRPQDPAAPLGKLVREVQERNPRCGEFYYLLGLRLEERRRFPAAEEALNEAARRMPELLGPQAALGLLYMRLGREDEARVALNSALEADPFHIRASNMAQVLEVLDGYETLETEHFLIRHDPRDGLLARYAGQYLEGAFPQLCESLGYRPEERTLFEIFRSARNTSGHGWFSARMIGLPYVGTVGACAGTMVAMTSPNDGPRGRGTFNWARVLRHEFVHVLNLRQTDFHIPHWFTEGLAVLHEDFPRPAAWDRLLARRVPRRELFDLSDLNLGFIRPKTAEDRDLAYCQAELYAQYFVERFGPGALGDLLSAFRDTPDTPEALRRAFGVEPFDVEQGYLAYLDAIVAEVAPAAPTVRREPAELLRIVRQDPDNLDAVAELAEREIERRPELARKLSEQVLRVNPGQRTAAKVLARLELAAQRFGEADRWLAVALDEGNPGAEALGLRVGLLKRTGNLAEAERLARLGTRRFPGDSSWLLALASVQEAAGRTGPLAATLTELADIDFDNVEVRRRLASAYLEAGKPEAAARWALEALYVDVLDAPSHRLRGAALSAAGQTAAGAEEFRIAVELDPDSRGDVRADVQTALRRHPDAAELQALAKQLAP